MQVGISVKLILKYTIFHKTFFTNNLTEFTANTISLKPIANAASVGVSNPKAAIGIAMIL